MAILTREKIQKTPRPRKRIAVPELGGDVYVASVTLRQRLAMGELVDTDGSPKDNERFLQELVCMAIVGEHWEPLFESPQDTEQVDGRVVERLAREVLAINGISSAGYQAIKGNSEAASSA
jgi:hypothetical protein